MKIKVGMKGMEYSKGGEGGKRIPDEDLKAGVRRNTCERKLQLHLRHEGGASK